MLNREGRPSLPERFGAIATALASGAVAGETGAMLGGYAASGDSVRGAIETLAAAVPMSVVDDGAVLRLSDAVPAPVAVAADEQGASAEEKGGPRVTTERTASGALPDEVAIAYYEPARDYQTGLQRARLGGPGRRVEKLELPAALTSEEAKAIAERRLAESWAGRRTATLALPWRRMDLRPGGRVLLADAPLPWRIAGFTLDHMVAELKLAGVAAAATSSAGASPGRSTSDPDEVHGATVLALLDLPPLDALPAGSPRIWVAAAGAAPGWRRASLSISLDAGASWTGIGTTAQPAIIGAATGILASGSAAQFDRVSSVEVELAHEEMWLESRDDRALVGGANCAMLGDELIQFGQAEPSGPGRFMLSRLLRGRRGTEWAMGSHVAGERFVLLDAATLLPVELGREAIGGPVRIMASGVGDAAPVEASLDFAGRALRPPAPVHLRCERLGDGTIRIGWTRRSRVGWAWLDGADAPIGEEGERYRLSLAPSVGAGRTVEVATPGYDYGPAEQAADGSAGAGVLTVSVAQLGSVAPSSPPATGVFSV
jgi:hypothetical protein